jgi:hypothetical protein
MLQDFRPTPRLRFRDDAGELAGLRQAALRELDVMRRENVLDLPVYARTVLLPTGERIVCRRTGLLDSIDIQAPSAGRREVWDRGGRTRPVAPEGTFYAIPECLARYEGMTGLTNAIPDGSLAGWSVGLGKAVTVCRPGQAGLSEAQGLPEAGLDREVGVFSLPGGAASGLLFGRAHIPDEAPFSVSCLVRLNAPLAYDSTYDDRNVLNPLRPYFLQSTDGQTFTWDCPGDIAPLLGFCSPHLHPDWSATITYPWAPWNENFNHNIEQLAGAKRLTASPCPEAPLLAGDGYRDALGHDYPYPYGFILGLQAAGLFVYGGNRLLGARISNFETQIGYTPVLTDALEIGLWHHVVLTHDSDGTIRIYLAREDCRQAWTYGGNQPLCAMDAACTSTMCGVNAWTLRNGTTGAAIGAYRMNPAMDVALPRFFHYALSASQAFLLQQEALDGLFVADDHEVAQGAAQGLTPITIERETA